MDMQQAHKISYAIPWHRIHMTGYANTTHTHTHTHTHVQHITHTTRMYAHTQKQSLLATTEWLHLPSD